MMKHKKITLLAAISAAAVLTISATAFAATDPAPEAEAVPAAAAEAVETSEGTFVTFEDETGDGVIYGVDGEKVEEVAYELDTETGVISENGKQIGVVETDENGQYVVSVNEEAGAYVTVSGTETDEGMNITVTDGRFIEGA